MIRGANPCWRVEGIELDKLYFFIAVSVIDPTAIPVRKSNAQISFSQIEHTSIPPILLSPRATYQPIFDPSTLAGTSLPHGKRSSNIFLARVILPTPSIAIMSSSKKLFSPKMSARESRGDGYYRISSFRSLERLPMLLSHFLTNMNAFVS